MDVNRSALVPYSAQQMFDLVNQIEEYPQFLPWCKATQVFSRTDTEVRARVDMAKGPLNQSFITRNTNKPGESIQIQLEEGPFSRLDGGWTFEALREDACKVSLEVHFDFSNLLARATLGPIFGQIANSMVDAFVQRAGVVYAAK